MAAARRRKSTAKAGKAKSGGKAKAKAKSKARKPARKSASRSTKVTAPLAEMDAAWQSLLETALKRHRTEAGASGSAKPRKAARKK